MITGINQSKKLTKHISCEFKCTFDGNKYNTNQWWNKDKCRYECKKHHICEKYFVRNPVTCYCENGKYLSIIIDKIISDEIIDIKETILMNKI